jgi:hypothetical protein
MNVIDIWRFCYKYTSQKDQGVEMANPDRALNGAKHGVPENSNPRHSREKQIASEREHVGSIVCFNANY